jgi:predicted Zn-dependent protease
VSSQILRVTVVAALLGGLAACADSHRFLPTPDAGSALAEAKAQSAASGKVSGTLTDRVRQLSPAASDDTHRLARAQRVADRLYAAARPFCQQRNLSCSYPVVLEDGGLLNAHADSRKLSISRPMVDLTGNDDQLALVLGHELAHLLLGHTAHDFGDRVMRAFDTAADKDDERQADYVGLYFAVRAGYDANRAIDLWRRMGTAQPGIIQGDQSHPGTAERYVVLRQTAVEIAQKQESGRPVMPNMAR